MIARLEQSLPFNVLRYADRTVIDHGSNHCKYVMFSVVMGVTRPGSEM